MNIPLSSPDITQKEIDAVIAVLRTPQLSLGPKLPEFESAFATYIGSKHAIAVNSGTSGLHLCMRALDIKDGDEVITTPFSFISSSNCILFERAKPVFVDIREDTLNIDEEKIEAKITSKTKAVLPVHVFGYPCDMEKINKYSVYKFRISASQNTSDTTTAIKTAPAKSKESAFLTAISIPRRLYLPTARPKITANNTPDIKGNGKTGIL